MGSSARGPGSPPTEQAQVVRSIADLEKRARQTSGIQLAEERLDAELTRTSRALRRVRTGYAYQPPAYRTYRRRRATCPQGPTYHPGYEYQPRACRTYPAYRTYRAPWHPRLDKAVAQAANAKDQVG